MNGEEATLGRRVKNLVAVASIFALSSIILASPAGAETWGSAGDLALARLGHQATLLLDGRVLVTGGNTPVGNGYNTKAAEIYDPSANTWSATGSTTNGRSDHTATRLADGKVLVAGGVNANICANDVTTELYNPVGGTWSFTGSLPLARAGGAATLLADGKVLLSGGGNRCGGVFTAASVYNPATGLWSATGSMNVAREWHNMVRLSDGRVLVAGGDGSNPFPALASAEIYNPATGTWTPTGSMATARCGCGAATRFLTVLADGRVMAAAGYSGTGFGHVPNGPSVEIFDPTTGLWSATGSMSTGRSSGTFSLLNDGTVLTAGGTAGTAAQLSAERWDPTTGTWSGTASLAVARNSHSATVLGNGTVLVAGGYGTSTYLSSAELYVFPPSAPLSLDATPGPLGTLGQIDLSWQPPANDGGAPISGYTLCRGTSSGGPYPACVNLGAGTLSYSDTSGFPLTTYHYVVSATNIAGPGASSIEACAKPSPWLDVLGC